MIKLCFEGQGSDSKARILPTMLSSFRVYLIDYTKKKRFLHLSAHPQNQWGIDLIRNLGNFLQVILEYKGRLCDTLNKLQEEYNIYRPSSVYPWKEFIACVCLNREGKMLFFPFIFCCCCIVWISLFPQTPLE